MSDSVRPHRRQPTRLLHPWDSPGKNTGVGCHFLLQCRKMKSESEVTQSCPTPSHPHGLQPTRLLCPWHFPGKSTGVGCRCLLWTLFEDIYKKRILEWTAISSSGRSSPSRGRTCISCASCKSCIAGRFFTICATGKAPYPLLLLQNKSEPPSTISQERNPRLKIKRNKGELLAPSFQMSRSSLLSPLSLFSRV